MGSSSQSPPTETTSVQTTELPDFVKGPAQSYLARAQDLSTQPFTAYEGERVAPLNSFHQAALDGGRQAIGTMLPGSMNVMNQFAQGAYNSPAYIHPFLGPQLPGAGLMPTGYTGSPGAGFQGYSPFPQAPIQPMDTSADPSAGTGGKGGAIAAPTPVELAPVPEGLQMIANNPSAQTFGGLTAGQIANPTGYATQPSQQQLNQAAQIQQQQTGDMGMDDDPLGNIAYYDNFTDWASNLRSPLGALAQVGYNVATDAPNTPFLQVNQDTGQFSWSDGQPVMDDFAISSDVLNQDIAPVAPEPKQSWRDKVKASNAARKASKPATKAVTKPAPPRPKPKPAPPPPPRPKPKPVWVEDSTDAGGYFAFDFDDITAPDFDGFSDFSQDGGWSDFDGFSDFDQ